MQIDRDLQDRYQDLLRSIAQMKRVVVAFSGGTDSTLLLKTCIDVLGNKNVIAFTAVSPTYPIREQEEAEKIAASFGARVILSDTGEMDDVNFLMNDTNRCYHCKSHLFRSTWKTAREEGYSFVVEGSNTDDLNDTRPGRKASQELNVSSPLLNAGLSKADVRALSKMLGLPTHNKPAQACLSSRIPYGTRITVAHLKAIEDGEAYLRKIGVSQVRVRHHGTLARIEVEEKDFEIVLAHRNDIATEFRRLDFLYTSLDLRGYRMGSMNESSEKSTS
ncbi:MAG TPA: ATP-dependent sacrificial sulfur transferase LarE [Syntrophorhabdaceae bacterium]|nr:ATP-dependent sacrificial sulfur transferase LarE [Syntrophorhabdaceae bacterium]